jgi:hypothetical protein
MFMKPQVRQTWMLYVDTECGSWILPDDFGDPADHWNDDIEEYDSEYEKRIIECCEDGKKIYSIERKFGWYANMSAPGYMDQTEVIGPYDTEIEAIKELFLQDTGGSEINYSEEEVCEFSSNFEDFLRGYTQALAFTSHEDTEDGNGESLFPGSGDFDSNYPESWDDYRNHLTDDEQNEIIGDAAAFYFDHLELIQGNEEQAGADFCFDRQGQGTGASDRGDLYGTNGEGEKLAKDARIYGTVTLMGTRNEDGDINSACLCH